RFDYIYFALLVYNHSSLSLSFPLLFLPFHLSPAPSLPLSCSLSSSSLSPSLLLPLLFLPFHLSPAPSPPLSCSLSSSSLSPSLLFPLLFLPLPLFPAPSPLPPSPCLVKFV